LHSGTGELIEEEKKETSSRLNHDYDDEDEENDDTFGNADDFCENYRKKQEAMLAELNSIYGERTNGITQQISTIAEYRDEEETKKYSNNNIEDPEREVPP
jgi:hypothetical protein